MPEDVQSPGRPRPQSLQLLQRLFSIEADELERIPDAERPELAPLHVRVQRGDVGDGEGAAQGLELPRHEHAQHEERAVDEPGDGLRRAGRAHVQLEGRVRQQAHGEARDGADISELRPPSLSSASKVGLGLGPPPPLPGSRCRSRRPPAAVLPRVRLLLGVVEEAALAEHAGEGNLVEEVVKRARRGRRGALAAPGVGGRRLRRLRALRPAVVLAAIVGARVGGGPLRAVARRRRLRRLLGRRPRRRPLHARRMRHGAPPLRQHFDLGLGLAAVDEGVADAEARLAQEVEPKHRGVGHLLPIEREPGQLDARLQLVHPEAVLPQRPLDGPTLCLQHPLYQAEDMLRRIEQPCADVAVVDQQRCGAWQPYRAGEVHLEALVELFDDLPDCLLIEECKVPKSLDVLYELATMPVHRLPDDDVAARRGRGSGAKLKLEWRDLLADGLLPPSHERVYLVKLLF
mmetsp:Transcript_201/g.485  ORF Transcript_201/g.485 Transcript_201/m.485 type:complete len:460 (+) Transcript_201:668-2047(+)